MFEDKLSDKIFVNQFGKNFRQPKKIDLPEVALYFQKGGYSVVEIEQIFRHVHGKLSKRGRDYFFKMSSTPVIGERTRNEASWNKQINLKIEGRESINMAVPKVYEEGTFKNNFYYVSDLFKGEFLATKNPPDVKDIEQWLDKIINVLRFFLDQNINDFLFPRDISELNNISSFSDFFYNQDLLIVNELARKDLSGLLAEEKKLDKYYKPALNHGDFVPWHMIENGSKFILVDGEHGSRKLPKYYDVAYLYERLFVGAQSPELAKSFLSKFIEGFDFETKNKFDNLIRPLLANRIISSFWHAKNENRKNDFIEELKKNFLENNLY